MCVFMAGSAAEKLGEPLELWRTCGGDQWDVCLEITDIVVGPFRQMCHVYNGPWKASGNAMLEEFMRSSIGEIRDVSKHVPLTRHDGLTAWAARISADAFSSMIIFSI